KVVVDIGLPAGQCIGREHAAAAEAGDAQAVGANDARRLGKADCGHLVAPRGNGGDAVAEAVLDHLRKGRAVAQGGEVDRELARAHVTPWTASTRFIRSTARAGSVRTRALSARRKSSLRCWSERVDCWPPIMLKWFCKPLI